MRSMRMSARLVAPASDGTSAEKFTACVTDTLTTAVHTGVPAPFASQVSGVIAQSGIGNGCGGLQQSMTVCPAPHGTSGDPPAGRLNDDALNEYVFAGSANLTRATSESIRPQPVSSSAAT